MNRIEDILPGAFDSNHTTYSRCQCKTFCHWKSDLLMDSRYIGQLFSSYLRLQICYIQYSEKERSLLNVCTMWSCRGNLVFPQGGGDLTTDKCHGIIHTPNDIKLWTGSCLVFLFSDHPIPEMWMTPAKVCWSWGSRLWNQAEETSMAQRWDPAVTSGRLISNFKLYHSLPYKKCLSASGGQVTVLW